MRLGRVPSIADARTLQFSNYAEALPAPPARELLDTTTAWPMLANDRFNCCTSAAAGHMIHHWTAANQHGIFLTDDDIIRAHASLTNDHLSEPVSMLDALKFWRKTGIGGHQIHSFVKGGPANPADLRSMIWLFGSGYIGLDLPAFACTDPPSGWPDIPWQIPADAPASATAPDPNMGHCVAAIGYDEQSIYAVTWGRLKTMTWEFFERYAVEVFAVLSTDWVAADAQSPFGFDTATLKRDLALVKAKGKDGQPAEDQLTPAI